MKQPASTSPAVIFQACYLPGRGGKVMSREKAEVSVKNLDRFSQGNCEANVLFTLVNQL